MTPTCSSLSLGVPELILAVGALVLLMIGVFAASARRRHGHGAGGRRPDRRWRWIALLGGDGAAFGGAFVVDPFARFMKVAGADRLGRGAAHVGALRQRAELRPVRVPGPDRCSRRSA